MNLDDQPATLWKLQRDGKDVACLVRLAPYGIEIDIAHDGEVVLTRAFDTDQEALAWADRKKVAREAQGWQPAPEPHDQGPKKRPA